MNGHGTHGTYTQWDITQQWKEQNNVICSNKDAVRDDRIK